MDNMASGDRRPARAPLTENPAFLISIGLCIVCLGYWFLLTKVYHFNNEEAAELAGLHLQRADNSELRGFALRDTPIPAGNTEGPSAACHESGARRKDGRKGMGPRWSCARVRHPWRSLAVARPGSGHAGIVLGMTGSGKTTLLKNIITQDLMRRMGPAGRSSQDPDGDLRWEGRPGVLSGVCCRISTAPAGSTIYASSTRRGRSYPASTPFYAEDDDYMAQVNMVFGSFNLHDEFFSKHQLNYLADIVRILHYTGVRFNFYDVIVAVLDQGVLQEQIDKARRHIHTDTSISMQRRLNFEMSVRNLMQSFEDRDRVPKIQGLLNECMTFSTTRSRSSRGRITTFCPSTMSLIRS